MNTLAAAALVILLIVVVIQAARGTLGTWVRSKFLNKAPAAAKKGA